MSKHLQDKYREYQPTLTIPIMLVMFLIFILTTSGCATFEGVSDDPYRQAFIEATGVLALQYALVEDDYEYREALRISVASADTYLSARYPMVPLQYSRLFAEFKAETVGMLSPEAQSIIALLTVFGDDLKGLFE